jgi:hypothetical protein
MVQSVASQEAAQIDSLPAGPGLDGLVAEQVMGWRRVHHVKLHIYEPGSIQDLEQFEGVAWIDPLGYAALGQVPPPYSTSDAAAAEVEAKFALRKVIRQYDGQYLVRFGVWGDEPHSYIEVVEMLGRTRPLAICLAALRAVMR